MDPVQKIIPANLGGTENLYDDLPFVGAVEFQDGIIATVPVLALLILSGSVIPDSQSQFRLVFVGIGAFISLVGLLVKPRYMTMSQFLSLQRTYRSEPHTFDKDVSRSVESVKVNSDADTRNKLGINKIYPDYNVIEREDGVMITMIELTGVDIGVLGTEADWESKADSLMNLVNGEIEEDIQFFMPMRQYDPTSQISRLDDRAEDPDIANDELLSWYYIDRVNFQQSMAEEAFYREYYVVIKTDPSEVTSESDYQQTGLVAVLDSIPIDGLKEVYMGIRDIQFGMLSDRERKHKQLQEANEKANKYRTMFDGPVGGTAEVLTGDQLGVILKEFWEGERIRKEYTDGYLRRKPYVMGPEELQSRGDEQ